MTELFAAVVWLILLKFIQLAVYPIFKGALPRFAYGISYPLSLLFLTLLTWYCGLIGVTLYAALIPFALLMIYFAYMREYDLKSLRGNLSWDIVFLLLFLAMLEVRYLNPSVSYGEKLMDHAFLVSIINNPVVSPADPWYAGGVLDVYYYLGHWMFGAIGAILGIKSTVVFNLILPTIFANMGVALFACGKLLLKRYHWLPIVTLFLVNPAFVYYLVLGNPLTSVMWDSTRTIENCITEYPIFSMLWGDPHAHVIAMFNQLLFIFLLMLVYLKWQGFDGKCRILVAAALALSLGSMPLINTWDVLVYAPLMLLFALLIGLKECRAASAAYGKSCGEPYVAAGDSSHGAPYGESCGAGAPLGFAGGIGFMEYIRSIPMLIFIGVPVVSIAIYAPYYILMNAGGIEGIGFVTTPTEIIPFLLVYGFFLFVLYAETFWDLIRRPYLIIFGVVFALAGYMGAGLCIIPALALIIRVLDTKSEKLPQDIIAAVGILIVMFTELVYLKDNMGEIYYRQNTVFKFGIMACMMLSVSCLSYIGRYLEKRSGIAESEYPEDADDRMDECADAGAGTNGTGLSHLLRGSGTIPALLLAAVIIAMPFLVPDLSYGYGGYSLDGMKWVDIQYPDDYEALVYLQSLDPKSISGIVEAEDGDYKYYSRVSSFTGIPTVIGMPFHEEMWRGSPGHVGERMGDVRRIYENPDLCLNLMAKYGMSHIFVGQSERDVYNVNLPLDKLTEVFSNGGTVIYRI